jgi:hypothetical protein
MRLFSRVEKLGGFTSAVKAILRAKPIDSSRQEARPAEFIAGATQGLNGKIQFAGPARGRCCQRTGPAGPKIFMCLIKETKP